MTGAREEWRACWNSRLIEGIETMVDLNREVPIKQGITDDGRMILDDDAWALVWSESKGYALRTLKETKDGMMPNDAIAITACFVRLERDPEFKDKMVKWFLALSKE
jgi:hypothetical protein